MYNMFNKADKQLIMIDKTYNKHMDLNKYDYIMIPNKHYRAVTKVDYKVYENKKTKRGVAYWDIETRPTEKYVK